MKNNDNIIPEAKTFIAGVRTGNNEPELFEFASDDGIKDWFAGQQKGNPELELVFVDEVTDDDFSQITTRDTEQYKNG